MNILQFLDRAGDGNRIKFQWLHECIKSANWRAANKKRRTPAFTEVSFATDAFDPGDLMGDPKVIGVIVWIAREDFERVQAEIRADRTASALAAPSTRADNQTKESDHDR